MTGSLGAEIVMSAEAAVASGDELAGDYLALLEAQGEYAYAFDFFTTSMLWTVIAAALVFLMHLGFATLEAGLTQSKNTVNILFKNVFIISVGIISYAVIGFNTHYPGISMDGSLLVVLLVILAVLVWILSIMEELA